MKWFIVKFTVDAYPNDPQWMLTPAASREQAVDNIKKHMHDRGVSILNPVAEMDQTHYVRKVGRPVRNRREHNDRIAEDH